MRFSADYIQEGVSAVVIGAWIAKFEKAYRIIRRDRKYFSAKADPTRDYIRRFSPPALSGEEIRDIDTFWKRFGIRLDHYRWHQMYYHITGIRDPRFIPQNLAQAVLYPYYNDLSETKVWADKNYFERFVPVMRFPRMLGQRIHGRYYDADHRIYTEEEAETFCRTVFSHMTGEGPYSIVIKETSDTKQGIGVKKYGFASEPELLEIIRNHADRDNYMIQSAIEQHPFFAQFNASSVNIVRITTWRNGKDILVFAPCIRFGVEGSCTDVAHIDGVEIVQCAGVGSDGRVKDKYVTLRGEKKPLQIENKQIPRWGEMLECVKKGHQYLEHFDIVAWDMTVDKQGQVICIEYNIRSPGTIVYQMADGPFAGEYTEEFLRFLEDKKNRRKYLPRKLQIRD